MRTWPWAPPLPVNSIWTVCIFVPAAHPPHKAGVTHAPYDDRVRMAELACQSDPRFEVSRLEEGSACSYSVETIRKVRATLAPGDELFFILGADAFSEIRTWYRWREVAASVIFLVVSRPGHLYDVPRGGAPGTARLARPAGLLKRYSPLFVRRKNSRARAPVCA